MTHINIVSRLEMCCFFFILCKCCMVSLKALPELESAFLKGIFCVFPITNMPPGPPSWFLEGSLAEGGSSKELSVVLTSVQHFCMLMFCSLEWKQR